MSLYTPQDTQWGVLSPQSTCVINVESQLPYSRYTLLYSLHARYHERTRGLSWWVGMCFVDVNGLRSLGM